MIQTKNLNSEDGAVLLILGVSCLVVIGFFVVTSFMGQTNTIETSLQAAADSAALAGASVLHRVEELKTPDKETGSRIRPTCEPKDCFKEALLVAIGVVEEHHRNGTINAKKMVSIDSDTYGPWNFGDLTVNIERGRWIEQEQRFNSLEDEDWDSRYPQLPRSIVSNAVRVSFQKRTPIDLFSILSLEEREISVSAIATSGGNSAVDSVPLAIPLCSLVRNGVLSSNQLCGTDIYFTSSERHCPNGSPHCGTLPDFSWDPQKPKFDWSSFVTLIDPGDDAPLIDSSGNRENTCSWSTPHTEEYGDNYAVFGLPGSINEQPTEEQVRLYMIDGFRTFLGDEYWVLKSGLTEQASNEIVWNLISNPDLAKAGRHNPLFKTELNNDQENFNFAFAGSKLDEQRAFCDPARSNSGNRFPRWLRPTYGACNSTRYGFGFWSEWDSSSNACNKSYTAPGVSPEAEDQTIPVWTVTAAVIADPSSDAVPCSNGEPGSSPDPAITKAGPYEVVGFVDVNLYDVDIGFDPPSYPHPCGVDPNFKYPATNLDTAVTREFPWGFWPPHLPEDGSVLQDGRGRCNLIRARIACGTRLLPSTKLPLRDAPQLVM